jgi:hypothetical protein
MSTNLATFADSEFNMRYKEPFITGGLNRKFAVAVPRGIYRGFRIEVDPGAGDRTVQISEDTTGNDHVAIYLTATGYALTLRRDTGDFLLDLSGFSSVTVILAIYASYAVGATTVAYLRAYTEAEYAAASEKNELVILGKVDVPGVGNPVTLPMISDSMRTVPWQSIGEGAIPWVPLHRNAGFEWADTAGAPYTFSAAYWRAVIQSGTATLVPSSSDPHSGDKCMVLDYTSGTVAFLLYQSELMIPVEENQQIRIQLYKKMVNAATFGTLTIETWFFDTSGSWVAGPVINLDTAVDGAYEEIDEIVRVPSGSNVTHLASIYITGTGLTFGASGAAIRFDDFQVWVQTSSLNVNLDRDSKSDVMANSVILRHQDDDWGDRGGQPLLRTRNQNKLRIDRADEKSGSAVTPISLELFGQLLDLGSNLLNSQAQMHTPRITTPLLEATTLYTLLWEIEDPAATAIAPVRIYAFSSINGGLAIVYNASWDGSNWNQDDATKASVFHSMGTSETMLSKDAGAAPWVAWDHNRKIHSTVAALYSDIISGSLALGTELVGTQADVLIPRLTTAMANSGVATEDRTCIFNMPTYSSSFGSIRFYRSRLLANYLEITYNAEWDGSQWDYDNASDGATKIIIGESGLHSWSYSGAGPWNDGVWVREYALYQNSGNYIYLNDKNFRIVNASANSNPVNTTAITNWITAKGIIKSWVTCQTNGGGGISTQQGLNAVASIAGSQLRVSFPGPMLNGSYAVATQVFSGGTFYAFTVVAKALGNVDLQCWTAAGATHPLNTNVLSCMVMVFAEQ